MSSQEIHALRQSPAKQPLEQEELLYLNSKFRNVADLVELDAAVSEAQHRREDATSKLSSSKAQLDELITNSRESAESYVQTAQGLSLIRHSIADELQELSERLISVSSNGLSPTLLEDVEALHRNLKELESVRGYVRIIEHALSLSESAVRDVREAAAASASLSKNSVAQYQALHAFVSRVSATCSSSEEANQTLHLVSFISAVYERTWSDIKEALASSLLEAAEQLKWPTTIDYRTCKPEIRANFERAFFHLLQLQQIGEQIRTEPNASEDRGGLYPLEALVKPISLRFKYHFEGERQTNRPDKPEWYFTHVLNAIHDQRPFMENVIQPLIAKGGYGNFNAWREFTVLTLPLLSRKLRRTAPSLLLHPSLLAHTIYQALSFDASLIELGFNLKDTTAQRAGEDETIWPGVSDVILGKKEWFDSWVEGEKRFAETQYNDIISATDAWQIADDDGEDSEALTDTRTTNSARRLPILESYYARISASLDAFETLSSALIRAVPGALGVSLGVKDDSSVNVDTRRLTTGIDGVQRLCKALLSARHITSALKVWGEDLFFIELWTEINQRAGLRAQAHANLALPNPTPGNTAGTIFEELISTYQKLSQRTEDVIVQQICAEVEAALKAHLNTITSQNANTPPSDDVAVSQTLLGPLALLSTHLTYARGTLPRSTMTVLYRRIASRLADHILQRQILYRGHVSPAEGKEALAECELWVETCHRGLGGSLGGGRKRVETPWGKLLQAGRVVVANGEIRDRIAQATFGMMDQEEWESMMTDTTGFQELSRDEVGRILRRRD
ncbi:hypothetical protein AAF712_000626 [Marasmius tenuissimus]|uniref:RINT-1 family protein n=1 Tax=Marasmius tenuissimus TaxID=585030 RepID=A0ABR3AED9_9AGAR